MFDRIRDARDWWRNRPKRLNVIERTKQKLVYGAIGLRAIVGFVAILVFRGC